MPTACFLFAHPDDEFAVTALISDRVRAGIQVSCVYLTDGAFAGQSPIRRRVETLAALARLGVVEGDVYFLGEKESIPDGSLHLHLERALGALSASKAATGVPSELFCPAWEGGHQDHDCVHLIALALDAQMALDRVRQFSIYHGAGLRGPFFRVMDPLPENGPTEDRSCTLGERLSQVLFCLNYPSQWKTFMGLLPGVAWHMLTDGRFRVQRLDARRVLSSLHSGPPLYERRGFMTEKDFRAAANSFMLKHIPAASAEPGSAEQS